VVRFVALETAISAVLAGATEFPLQTLPDWQSTAPEISGFLATRDSAGGSPAARHYIYEI
jgi:hypothetical protein